MYNYIYIFDKFIITYYRVFLLSYNKFKTKTKKEKETKRKQTLNTLHVNIVKNN